MKRWITVAIIGLLIGGVNTLASAEMHVPLSAWPTTWVKGATPEAYTPDEVYVIECWATWCHPCLRAMPHLEALHQALKAEGIHFIGVNIGERRDAENIRAFLAQQPTPPTYAIALDPNNELQARFKFKGIPFAVVIRNGEVIWKGHPSNLTETGLRAIRKTGVFAEEKRLEAQPKEAKVSPMQEAEQRAQVAVLAGDWSGAIQAQRAVLLAHPLQQLLSEPYVPAVMALPQSTPILPATEILSQEGDLAPYAAFLKRDLPADKGVTVVAYWKWPFWVERLTYATRRHCPGRSEAIRFKVPYRLLTFTSARADQVANFSQKMSTYELPVGEILADREVPAELFGVSDRYNPPFLAVFCEGKLLYKGSIEQLPSVFKTVAPSNVTAAYYQDAIAKEQQQQVEAKRIFLALRDAKTAPERLAIVKEVESSPTLPPWIVSFALPYCFGPAYEAQDVEMAKRLVQLYRQRYAKEPAVLEILYKLMESWPELATAMPLEQSILAEHLGETETDRDDLAYQSAWLKVAAEFAKAANDTVRQEQLLKRAIELSPAGDRWQQLNHHHAACPTF